MDDASAQLVLGPLFLWQGQKSEKAQSFRCRCGLEVWTKLMAWASDGPASSADLGWRSKDLTELTEHATLDAGAGKDFVPTALVHELFGYWAQRCIVLLGKWRCVWHGTSVLCWA